MVERRDVEAAVEARQELGRGYDDHIVDSLLAKIDQRLEERRAPAPARHHGYDIRVPIATVALGVGATAIATGNGAAWLAVIVWVMLAVINIAYAFRRA